MLQEQAEGQEARNLDKMPDGFYSRTQGRLSVSKKPPARYGSGQTSEEEILTGKEPNQPEPNPLDQEGANMLSRFSEQVASRSTENRADNETAFNLGFPADSVHRLSSEVTGDRGQSHGLSREQSDLN